MRAFARYAAIALIAAGLAPAARAQSGLPPVDMQLRDNTFSGAMLRGSRFVLAADEIREYRLENYFLRNNVEYPASSYLGRYPERIYGFERIELSPFQTALQGAGMGMTAGLFTGAMAGTFGLWDEKTSWYVAGAMGALGAILGGTYGANDSGFSIHYRLTDD